MTRDKCRYCARNLLVIPHTPADVEPHCQSKGCRFCVECWKGETSVSPVIGRVEETA
jgi:hypothetical protein